MSHQHKNGKHNQNHGSAQLALALPPTGKPAIKQASNKAIKPISIDVEFIKANCLSNRVGDILKDINAAIVKVDQAVEIIGKDFQVILECNVSRNYCELFLADKTGIVEYLGCAHISDVVIVSYVATLCENRRKNS